VNPRLVEPGFAVVFLHADVPARPGKDEYGQDDAQEAGRHGNFSISALTGPAQDRPSAMSLARVATWPYCP
jgi:hypothetical protein